jgi:hypothetical protein
MKTQNGTEMELSTFDGKEIIPANGQKLNLSKTITDSCLLNITIENKTNPSKVFNP